jgi:hypothetical protein
VEIVGQVHFHKALKIKELVSIPKVMKNKILKLVDHSMRIV